MSQERFEKGMDELKQKYNQVQPVTSSKEIFQSVQQSKRNNSMVRYWPMLAATIGIFVIGGILLGSILSGTEMGQGSGDNPLTTGDNGEMEIAGSDGDETLESENGEVTDPNEPVEYAVSDRQQTLTNTYSLEGQEEVVTYNLYVNEGLGFSTYLEPGVEVSEVSSGEGDGVKYTHSELFHFTILKANELDDSSLAAWENSVATRYDADGFKRHDVGEKLSQKADVQGVWLSERDGYNDLFRYYALVEANGAIYLVEAEYTIEMMEGRFPYTVQTFVDNMEFH
ncbi:hypothetical protein [Evansella tamaricis]|uniref:Uncharacterized protein n=1 Tax=Evansella tamaricis TaxID=2069301 RepID=A0ABS6JMA2_9BACI|nr:hypothetical protein [Evansella tamaricis]MBU9714792.1 hypothetical protein [Evansella tamaricis]